MNKIILFLLLVILVAFGGWALGYQICASHTPRRAPSPEGMAYWLRDQYQLNDAQFNAVRQLMREGMPRAKELSRQAKAAYDELAESLNKTPVDNALVAQKAAAYVKVKSALRKDRDSHIEEIAALMTPQQASLFLQEIKDHPRE